MDASNLTLAPVARFFAIVCPTLFAGVCAADSFFFVPLVTNCAPNAKIMARQWLHQYQHGPYWVPELILPGALANVYLALHSASATQQYTYLAAVVSTFVILPFTFGFMEPGINGALKWKVQALLKEDGPKLGEKSWYPSAHRHSASPASRQWADKTEVRELVLFWGRMNNLRWIVTLIAAGVSGWATFGTF